MDKASPTQARLQASSFPVHLLLCRSIFFPVQMGSSQIPTETPAGLVCKESISLDHEPRTLYLSSQPTAAVPHTLCPPKLNFSFPEFTRVCSPPGFWTALCFAWRNPTHLSNLSINTISSGKTSECLKRTWSLPSLCSWILCIRSPL